MKELNHDGLSYKGLGNLDMDRCQKRYADLRNGVIALLFFTIVLFLYWFISDVDTSISESFLFGIAVGIDLCCFIDFTSDMQKIKLRMKELEVVE